MQVSRGFLLSILLLAVEEARKEKMIQNLEDQGEKKRLDELKSIVKGLEEDEWMFTPSAGLPAGLWPITIL